MSLLYLCGFVLVCAKYVTPLLASISFYKFTNCILNDEELSEQWKESINVPIYKKGYKTECSNYRGISLLSTS
jgi:hypothetical protein